MRLRNLQNEVREILTNKPYTRNSDRDLYCAYLAKFDPSVLRAPFVIVMQNKDLPSIESVGRARRKVQELYPELRADANVEAFREVREEEYRDYAVGVHK